VAEKSEKNVERLGPAKVVFACVANAGRSQMAAALFNKLANPKRAHAVSAGTRPGQAVHRQVVAAMHEIDVDLSQARPQYLSSDVTNDAHIVITMGCGDECPLIPGVERDDWPMDDPTEQPVEVVRRIRDDIRNRVSELIKERRWA
jgi:arsenate reductase